MTRKAANRRLYLSQKFRRLRNAELQRSDSEDKRSLLKVNEHYLQKLRRLQIGVYTYLKKFRRLRNAELQRSDSEDKRSLLKVNEHYLQKLGRPQIGVYTYLKKFRRLRKC